MMFKAEAMQARLNQFRRQLTIRGVDRQQTAAHDALRRTAFVHVDVGSLGTDHGLVRVSHGIDAQSVTSCAVEGEEDPRLLAELFAEFRFRGGAVFIVAIGQCVFFINAGDGFHHLGTDARMVVASESSFHG